MFEPDALGIDSTGNIWVSSYTDPTGTVGIASKFSPTGQPLLPNGVSTTGLTNSYGLAIDASDNVWIPYEKSPYAINTGLGAVAEFNSSGQSISGTGFANGGLNFPIATALDPNGTAWIVNYGNASLTTLSSTGQPLSAAPATPPHPSPFPPPSPSTPATTPGSAIRTTTPSPASPPTAPNLSASPAATAPTASPSTSAATSGRPTTSATASARSPTTGTVISSGYTGRQHRPSPGHRHRRHQATSGSPTSAAPRSPS